MIFKTNNCHKKSNICESSYENTDMSGFCMQCVFPDTLCRLRKLFEVLACRFEFVNDHEKRIVRSSICGAFGQSHYPFDNLLNNKTASLYFR